MAVYSRMIFQVRGDKIDLIKKRNSYFFCPIYKKWHNTHLRDTDCGMKAPVSRKQEFL
jgi:hypothetical protein